MLFSSKFGVRSSQLRTPNSQLRTAISRIGPLRTRSPRSRSLRYRSEAASQPLPGAPAAASSKSSRSPGPGPGSRSGREAASRRTGAPLAKFDFLKSLRDLAIERFGDWPSQSHNHPITQSLNSSSHYQPKLHLECVLPWSLIGRRPVRVLQPPGVECRLRRVRVILKAPALECVG